MSKSQSVILKRVVRNDKNIWTAKIRRTLNWGGRYSGSDEKQLKDIEGSHSSKTQAIWNLRSLLDGMLRDAKREKQDLEWKIKMLEEMSEEAGERSNNLYEFKNQFKKNKIKTRGKVSQ